MFLSLSTARRLNSLFSTISSVSFCVTSASSSSCTMPRKDNIVTDFLQNTARRAEIYCSLQTQISPQASNSSISWDALQRLSLLPSLRIRRDTSNTHLSHWLFAALDTPIKLIVAHMFGTASLCSLNFKRLYCVCTRRSRKTLTGLHSRYRQKTIHRTWGLW